MRDVDDEMLTAYCHGLAEITNLFADKVEADQLANALLSGAVEILRREVGVAAAAHRLELAAEAVVEQNRIH